MNARPDDNITFTRGDIGQFASIGFALFLLLSVLAYFYEGGMERYILMMLLLAGGSLVAWIVFAPQEFMAFLTGRQARRGTVAVFSTFLFIGIVVMAYIYVERKVITFDLTESQAFTLSASTEVVLDRIERPIRIVGFYSADNLAAREIDDQYWRQYEKMSDGLITREYIDPIEQPAVADAYQAADGDLFLAYVDETTGDVDPSTLSYVPREDKQERYMTQAINRLLQTGNFAAFFDTNHGARSLRDESGEGITVVGQLLGLNGWRVVEFDLADLAENDQPIPSEASVVVLAGTRQDFSQAEINTIDAYLQDGGSVYIMTDPILSGAGFLTQDSAFNDYLWDHWGIAALDAVVIEPAVPDVPSPLYPVAVNMYDSIITANLNLEDDITSRPMFALARSLTINQTPPVNNGVAILTSDAAYGETDLQALGLNNDYHYDSDADYYSTQILVAFAFNADTNGKVLMIGDSDFITDGYINAPAGNAQLLINGFNWLTDFDEEVTFGYEPTAVSPPTIFVSTSQLDRVTFFVVFLVPGLMLAAGSGVWFYRSRR